MFEIDIWKFNIYFKYIFFIFLKNLDFFWFKKILLKIVGKLYKYVFRISCCNKCLVYKYYW